jgi:hypothetical protein
VCLSCKGYFLETLGTPFHAKLVEPDKLVWAIAALAEGLGIRAVARVFETAPNTESVKKLGRSRPLNDLSGGAISIKGDEKASILSL